MADEKRRVSLRVIDDRELDRQLDRGALFQYSMQTSALDRIHDVSIFVYATMELLLAKGVIKEDELAASVAKVKQRLAETHWTKERGFSLNPDDRDKYQVEPAVVDCEARMHLCKGVCCHMEHPLQLADVAEGVAKWDHGRPYWLRRGEGNRCSHLGGEGRCGIFEHRPLTCRTYSCKDDVRVWRDFEGRVPNQKGIAAILERKTRT